MRKIVTQNEIDRRKKRNILIIGLLMIFLMVFSSIAYSFLDNSKKSDENVVVEKGLTFYRYGDNWRTQIDGQLFEFIYLPSETEELNINGTFSFSDYFGKVLYYNELNEGTYEVLKNLNGVYQRGQEACVFNETCAKDVPVKTCSDNLFIFKESEENNVYKSQNCVYIIGDPVKGADALLYKLLGVN